MDDLIGVLKSVENAGIAGLMVWCTFRLVKEWAPQFLLAQQKTAEAMLKLAEVVKESQADQKEMLIAVRVLATEMCDVKGYLKELREAKKG